MNIIQNRKTYFIISGALFTASILAMLIFGFKLGIDFTGGSLLEIRVADGVATDQAEIQTVLTSGENKVLENATVQSAGDRGYLLRFRDVNEEEHQAILRRLRQHYAGSSATASSTPVITQIEAKDAAGKPVKLAVEPLNDDAAAPNPDLVVEQQFESVGPVVGNELKRRSIYSLAAVMLAIILYITWAFRKVSRPVASWKYGVVAVTALVHDVVIPTGIFVALGRFFGIEIDVLYVTAILTMLGFSVHDTIVVFDRTRENLTRSHLRGDFEAVVNQSVNETVRRSINTSLTAFLALFAIYLFGGESVRYFVLALMLGVVVGTYSSIFIASPLLVVWEKWSRR